MSRIAMIAVVLMFCVACVAPAPIAVAPTLTPEPTLTATPMPTVTPLPTATLVPTATLEPSATATATVVPTVTATPGKPRMADRERIYLQMYFAPELAKFAEGMTEMGALLQEPKFTDLTWKLEMLSGMLKVQESYAAVADFVPPEAVHDVSEAYVAAMFSGNAAVDLLMEAIDELDADKFNQAHALILQCGEELEAADALFQEYAAQFATS